MQCFHTFLPVLPVKSKVTHAMPSHSPPSSPCQQSSDTCSPFRLSSQFSPLSVSTVTQHMHPLHTLIADLPILPVNHPHIQPICGSPCQQSHSICILFIFSWQFFLFCQQSHDTGNNFMLPSHFSPLSLSHNMQTLHTVLPLLPTLPVTQHATTSHCSPTSPHSPCHTTCNHFTLFSHFSPLSLSHNMQPLHTVLPLLPTLPVTQHATTSHCSPTSPHSPCHTTCNHFTLFSHFSPLSPSRHMQPLHTVLPTLPVT